MNYPTIVITADAPVKRMKHIGSKSNIPLNDNELLINKQIRLFKSFFNNKCNIVVVIGYMKEKIKSLLKDSNVFLTENKNYKNCNQAESFFVGANLIKSENYIFCSNDIVFGKNLGGIIKKATQSTIITEKNENKNRDIGCVSDEHGNVSNMDYKMPYTWLNLAILKDFDKAAFDKAHNQKLFFFEIFNKMIDAGIKLKNEVVNDEIFRIESFNDIDAAKIFAEKNQ